MSTYAEKELNIKKVIKKSGWLYALELAIYLIVNPQVFDGIPGIEGLFYGVNGFLVPTGAPEDNFFQIIIQKLLDFGKSIWIIEAAFQIAWVLIPVVFFGTIIIVLPIFKIVKNRKQKAIREHMTATPPKNPDWGYASTLTLLQRIKCKRNLKKLQEDTTFSLVLDNSTCIRIQKLLPDDSDFNSDSIFEWDLNNKINYVDASGSEPLKLSFFMKDAQAYLVKNDNEIPLALNVPFGVMSVNKMNKSVLSHVITWIGDGKRW